MANLMFLAVRLKNFPNILIFWLKIVVLLLCSITHEMPYYEIFMNNISKLSLKDLMYMNVKL